MKNLEKYTPEFLLILIVIYFSQDVLYTGGGSIIAQLSLFIILSLSGIYWIKSLLLKTKKPVFYKAWTVLLLLNLFGFIFTADFSFSGHFGQLKNILLVSLPFYPFYHFSNQDMIKKRSLIMFFIVIIAISIAQFYTNRANILSMRVSDNIDVVNNVAYNFVYLIPFLFLFKEKKVVSMLLAFIIMFFIIQGAKRGAMISGAIGMLHFAYYQIKTIDKKNRYKGFIIVSAGIITLSIFGYKFFLENEYLVQRLASIATGDSSGRDVIYANLFKAWLNSESYVNLLLGHGFGSSIFLSGTGNWAHNDWLELLTNFGLLGVIIYLTLFVVATKIALGTKWDIDKRIVLMSVLSIWLFTTIVSMNYTSTNSIFQTIMLAYLFGNERKFI